MSCTSEAGTMTLMHRLEGCFVLQDSESQLGLHLELELWPMLLSPQRWLGLCMKPGTVASFLKLETMASY